VLDQGEICDGGAGCLANCSCPNGQVADGNKGCMVPLCGNNVLDQGETCDGGAGCLANCSCPNGQVADGNKGCMVPPLQLCGNGVLNPNEQCDGGVNCSANCTCPLGFVPDGNLGCFQVEICDDGVDNDGDLLIDAGDPYCHDKTVAGIGIYLTQPSFVRILTADGDSWEQNTAANFTLSITIDGSDGVTHIWVQTTGFSAQSPQGFVVWVPGVAPPAWPVGNGMFTHSFTATFQQSAWVNFSLVGAGLAPN
jgi:hypothetical protein